MKKIGILVFILTCLSLNGVSQTAENLLENGREAYLNYDFGEASRLYAQAKKKSKASDSDFNALYDTYLSQLNAANNYLERVEKLVIIDSITVPRDRFFKSYRLPSSSGYLDDGSSLPFRKISGVDYVFSNEGEDYKLWSQPDSTGRMHLVESRLLTDGKWSEPESLDEDLSEDGDAIFPFMMSDGVTLYYADNGDNSIGGYDIMVAMRDPTDGSFLQPSNLGFPYNSPYDDYLLAIDELNGVGWWATDRNRLEDEITVYVFIYNDTRENYPADEEDLAGFARIDNYIATQPEDADYDELLTTIRSIDPSERKQKAEFTLPAPGGKTYHRYDELSDAKTRMAVKQYLDACDRLQKSEKELEKLRKQYNGNRSEATASAIRKAEKNIETERMQTAKMCSELYKILK